MKIVEIDYSEFARIQIRNDIVQNETVLLDKTSRNIVAFLWDDNPNNDMTSLRCFKVLKED